MSHHASKGITWAHARGKSSVSQVDQSVSRRGGSVKEAAAGNRLEWNGN